MKKWIISVILIIILLSVIILTYNNEYYKIELTNQDFERNYYSIQSCYCLGNIVLEGTKKLPLSRCNGIDICFSDTEEYIPHMIGD